ncbi:MAG: hypothetical protein LBI32_01215 [Myroides odoratus]|jgi:RHS repeat-associated protein|nr:hypothetical protein [Myroides odoratus]
MKTITRFYSLIILFISSFAFGQTEEIELIFDPSEYLNEPRLLGEQYSTVSGMDTVATIKGDASVSRTGGLNYVIPIDVVAGVNSFEPNISLVYNSMASHGVAGWGWNIAGLSIITDGSKSKEVDKNLIVPKNDGRAPYYLDGQRLLPTSEAGVYVTLLYSQIQIKKVKHPEYGFIIHYPNGKISKYKEMLPYTYMISEMSDAYGNMVNYEYNVLNQNIYLSKISYGSTLKNYITFNYKNRGTKQVKYRKGQEAINDKVLDYIMISKPGDEHGIYRKYSFQYDHIQQKTVERLRQVTIENSEGETLKPLKFSYTVTGDRGSFLYSQKRPYKTQKNFGIGDVIVGDFYGNGDLFPIYEIETKQRVPFSVLAGVSEKPRILTLWDPLGGVEITNYENKNKKLFSGKALVDRTVNNKKERVISRADLLLTLSADYLDAQSDIFTLQFYDVSGLSNQKNQGTLSFLLPKFIVKNEIDTKPIFIPSNKRYKSKDAEFPHDELTTEFISNKVDRKFLVADFNNDGLVDLLVFTPKGEGENSKMTIHFAEIGSLIRNGESIELRELDYDSNVIFNAKTTVYPIDFDGDGLSEFMTVDEEGNLNVFKINFDEFDPLKIRDVVKLNIGINKIENYSSKKPIVFGDFNGDGLTDFIVPDQAYEFNDGSNLEQELRKMNTDRLYWTSYISTGWSFIVKKMDFTDQKLAYIVPSQRNEIKRYSDWKKFWSGKQDKYLYTEYGTSNIMAMDVNGDGITDLVSMRKYGRAKYEKNLIQSTFENDFGFVSPLQSTDGIQMYIVKPNSTGDFNVSKRPVVDTNGQLGFSLKDIKISPFSLIIARSEFNSINTYNNGVVIHDPMIGMETSYIVKNDNSLEGQLKEIDNGSGNTLVIEYSSMVEDIKKRKGESTYIFNELNLPYPYYVHKSNSNHQIVSKIHSIFDGKILTKEHKYYNAIQHFYGQGFIGFQKTAMSDPYESIIGDNGVITIKDASKGSLWRTNTYLHTQDNALISSVYGSLGDREILSKTTIVNQRFRKGLKRYLILPISEKIEDFLNGFETKKENSYETGGLDLLLKKSEVNYYTLYYPDEEKRLSGTEIKEFKYTPKFVDRQSGAFFYGLFQEVKTTSKRDDHIFTAKEEFSYTGKGAIKIDKKYGHETEAITTSYEYYDFGGIKNEKVSASGIVPLTTAYKYDQSNRFIIEITTPDGLVSKNTVNQYGTVLSQEDGLGRRTDYQIDSWNNVHTITDYLGNKLRTKKLSSAVNGAKYDVAVLGADGSEKISSYDALNRPIETRVKSLNNKWAKTRLRYDIYGNVVSNSEPFYDGETIHWNYTFYDPLQRPIEINDYKGRVIKLCYEKNKITTIDEGKISSKLIDAQGYEVMTQDHGGMIFNFYYANGSLKETVYDGLANSIWTRFEIDGWGNKTKLIDPSAGTYTYKYDNFNRVKETENPKGAKTTYTYDSLGRLVEETTRGSMEEDTDIRLSYTYDSRTRLPTSISGNYNGNSFSYLTTYDLYGRIKTKTETTPKFTYSNTFVYDSFGRVEHTKLKTTLRDSNISSTSSIYNVYDVASGILKMQKDGVNSNSKTIWELNSLAATGAHTKMTLGNGVVEEYKYNVANLLQNIKHTTRSQTITDIDYFYNSPRGTLTRRSNKVFNANEQFSYDDLDRLLSEHLNGVLQNEYTYDRRGRITSNAEIGKYNYNPRDYKLRSIDFNEKGSELLQDRGFAVVNYNVFKSPNEIYLENKGRVNYEFSILKNRYASFFGSTEEKAKQPIQKYYSADKSIEIVVDKDRTQLISYLTGDAYSANYIKIDEIKGGRIVTSKNYYLHRDNQATILAISDAAGGIVEQRFFDAWGNLKDVKIKGVKAPVNILGWNTDLLLDRGYTGHEHLYTIGYIHMNGRIYDPKLRQFLSPDNYVQDNTNSQSYNRYGYVLNNPLLYTDFSGELWTEIGIGAAIGVAIAITTNAVINVVNGVPFWYGMGKSATMGAISGAVSFGIGEAMASLSSTLGNSAFLVQAGMHGVSSGLMSEIDGGTFISGFASGAIASLITYGIGQLGPQVDAETGLIKEGVLKSSETTALMIAGGGLSGGISSTIAGGNFWKGMQQGLIVSGLNHTMHSGFDKLQQNVDKDNRRELTKQERQKIGENYPNYDDYPDAHSVYQEVGGNLYKLYLGAPEDYINTCAIRLSVAFEKSGIDIGGDYYGAKGLKYYTAAAKFFKALEKRFVPQSIRGLNQSQYGIVIQFPSQTYSGKVHHVDVIYIKNNKGVFGNTLYRGYYNMFF